MEGVKPASGAAFGAGGRLVPVWLKGARRQGHAECAKIPGPRSPSLFPGGRSQQNALPREPGGASGAVRCGQRQPDDELRSLTRRAHHDDLPVMLLHDFVADREPQA